MSATTSIYIVLENGQSYTSAYRTFAMALAAVHAVWGDEVYQQGNESCSVITLPENLSGNTVLYVEKGIHIEILRLNVSG
jgi:hypothetical protein